MFELITQRLESVLRTLRGAVRVDEKSLDVALRDLRLALLEADVNYGVVKEFLGRVRQKALGADVLASLTPGQQVIKVVHEQMVELLGGAQEPLRLQGQPPQVILLFGLQGAGKTTTAAKLGHLLQRDGHSPVLTSVDVNRPAAGEQLAQLAASAQLPFFQGSEKTPLALAQEALAAARKEGHDVLLLDTAGRLHLDEALMREASGLAAALAPAASLYVADSLAGQDAVTSVKAFAEQVGLTGIVLSKLDGDARGGVALSIVSVTGLPVLYVGIGETYQDLEPFYPDRIASRILGMGDVLTLIERAQAHVDAEEAAELEQRFRQATFTLEDFRQQLRQISKMGPMSKLLEMLPGSPDLKSMATGEDDLRRFSAIIDSMTQEERYRPSSINGNRRRRIARGSGTTVQDVNRLLKQFAMARKLMKQFGRLGRNPMDLMRASGLGL
ncbi:MAG: signal recognition particle protein [Acidobacteriota bacterium]